MSQLQARELASIAPDLRRLFLAFAAGRDIRSPRRGGKMYNELTLMLQAKSTTMEASLLIKSLRDKAPLWVFTRFSKGL